MIKHKLIETRKKKGFSQEYMSNVLSMDVSCYNRKEKGQIKISNQEWQKLAEVLEIPLEDIYESDEGMIFIFNDNSSGTGNGSGNIVTNYTIPQSILDSQKKYIEKLEEDVRCLKEENLLLKNAQKES